MTRGTWMYNEIDGNKRVQLIYIDSNEGQNVYVVDVRHEDTLDITIKLLPLSWQFIHPCLCMLPTERRVQVLHKVDIDKFLRELTHVLSNNIHLTKTESVTVNDGDIDEPNNKHKTLLITPMRDIYEAIQDLVVKY